MQSKKKVPRQQEHPNASKQVRQGTINPGSFDSENIVWGFGLLDHEGPFGWGSISPEEAWEMVTSKFKVFESLSWNDLKTKTGSHSISTMKIAKEAKQRLEEIHQADLDELFSLRITGKNRIWGIRDRYTLKILWWDPEHKVCPSAKKHT